MAEHQVIIVGGGPAGSACAKALKEEEIEIISLKNIWQLHEGPEIRICEEINLESEHPVYLFVPAVLEIKITSHSNYNALSTMIWAGYIRNNGVLEQKVEILKTEPN